MPQERTLKQVRMKKGSLLACYKATGVMPSAMSSYENGHVIPTYRTCLKLSPWLEISPEEIQRLAYEAQQERRRLAGIASNGVRK